MQKAIELFGVVKLDLKRMKRKILITFIALLGFVCGWICACIVLQRQFAQRQLNLQKELHYDIRKWQDNVKSLRQHIYGSNNFHRDDAAPAIKALLTAFAPSRSTEFITLTYVSGLGDSDHGLNLYGNGTLESEVRGVRQLISTIPNDRCKSFYYRVLTSGILNYSEGIVALKVGLLDSNRSRGVTDRPNTEIRISVPELKINKTISVYAPDVELENFPDIIEFQLITQIEKEILDLVPKDYPLWK